MNIEREDQDAVQRLAAGREQNVAELEAERTTLLNENRGLREDRDCFRKLYSKTTEVLGAIHETLNKDSEMSVVGMEAVQVKQLKEERDALAADIERLKERARLVTDHRQWDGDNDPRVPHALLDKLSEASMDAPDTSLSHRDAEVRGKALREVAAHLMNGAMTPSELVNWCLEQDRAGRQAKEEVESLE